jgi:glycosyltransferase involved in cell wall biosynthesis
MVLDGLPISARAMLDQANQQPATSNASVASIVWQSRWGIPNGYAITSELMALALDDLGAELIHRPTPWHVPATIRHPRLQAAAARPIRDELPQVSYDQADLFYTAHPGKKVGFTMLEVDGLPADWVAACNAMDEVWTPSHWGAEVFRASGVTRPIHVVPLGIDPERFRPQLPTRKLHDRFVFLSVFEWGERKAPEKLLRAYARAFSRRDDVLLLLRVNNFDGNVHVAQQIADLGLPKDAPPVAVLYNQQLDGDSLGSLYASADCFVLPTRGEGWGMPVLEAMACGLPVIATDWSGQTEFFNAEVGFPLQTRALVPAEARCPYYTGLRWADPDEEHLQHLLRYVYEHPAEARAVGARAAEAARTRWTWRHTAERILARLNETGTGADSAVAKG